MDLTIVAHCIVCSECEKSKLSIECLERAFYLVRTSHISVCAASVSMAKCVLDGKFRQP